MQTMHLGCQMGSGMYVAVGDLAQAPGGDLSKTDLGGVASRLGMPVASDSGVNSPRNVTNI